MTTPTIETLREALMHMEDAPVSASYDGGSRQVLSSALDELAQLRERVKELEAQLAESSEEHQHTIAAMMDAAQLAEKAEKEARLRWPKCANCHKTPANDATCFGTYEDPAHPVEFACDECCGHSNEDGWCEQITDTAVDFLRDLLSDAKADWRKADAENWALLKRAESAEARCKALEEEFTAYRNERSGLTHYKERVRALEAEIETLTQDRDEWRGLAEKHLVLAEASTTIANSTADERDALREENARLREALAGHHQTPRPPQPNGCTCYGDAPTVPVYRTADVHLPSCALSPKEGK